MKVLIVNTSERKGGAAVAAGRLLEALNGHGVKAKMLVRDIDDRQQKPLTVVPLPGGWRLRWHFLWERIVVWMFLHFRRQHLFDVDIANSSEDITRLPEFQEADVIHLHWINQGMLSLNVIRKILASGKPVVWTMHDIWPATALCHLTVWQRHQRMMHAGQVTFVACSERLAGEARRSALLQGHEVVSIPNPINHRVFCPGDCLQARQQLSLPTEGRIILFASQRVTNVYKGMDYLIEACRLLVEQHPECREQISVAVMGGQADEVVSQLPFRTFPLGYVSSKQRIIQAYQAADVFVLPSLSENLPNTIMEAMACGIPSVAFQVGGIPEEIDHRQNGYVARYRDAADLAEGIWWTLFDANQEEVRRACLQKVARCYSQQRVAEKYIEIYENLHHHHHV